MSQDLNEIWAALGVLHDAVFPAVPAALRKLVELVPAPMDKIWAATILAQVEAAGQEGAGAEWAARLERAERELTAIRRALGVSDEFALDALLSSIEQMRRENAECEEVRARAGKAVAVRLGGPAAALAAEVLPRLERLELRAADIEERATKAEADAAAMREHMRRNDYGMPPSGAGAALLAERDRLRDENAAKDAELARLRHEAAIVPFSRRRLIADVDRLQEAVTTHMANLEEHQAAVKQLIEEKAALKAALGRAHAALRDCKKAVDYTHERHSDGVRVLTDWRYIEDLVDAILVDPDGTAAVYKDERTA